MARAADRFVDALDEARRPRPCSRTTPERLNWHFIPRPRKGLPIKELSSEQRALAFGLIQSGLGPGPAS